MAGLALGCALFSCGRGALAAEEGSGGKRLAVSYTERSLTLPKLVLSPELGFHLGKVPLADTRVGVELGARLGITDQLEVFAVVAPIEFAPEVGYVNPSIGATYSFLRKGNLELGARLGVTIITKASEEMIPVPTDSAGVLIEPGVPMVLHLLHDRVRVDAGVFLPIQLSQTSGLGVRVPIEFAYDVTEPFHVGLRSGVGILNLAGSSAGNNLYVPLGVFAGYAIGGRSGPLLDIDPFFTWREFARPAVQGINGTNADKLVPGDWVVGVNLAAFLYL